jgi:hypothetical protein
MIRIEFDQAFPEAYRERTTELLRRYEDLFPLWAQEVAVSWERDDNGTRASMQVGKDYRRVSVCLYPVLWEQPQHIVNEVMIHEICHCFNSPLADEAFDILRTFIDPDTEDEAEQRLFKTLKEKLRVSMEQINTDFTYSISRLIDSLQNDRKANYSIRFSSEADV